ncbi:hypothetical protein K439DRAFT_1657491 [Ramaria rubella]|nr:hypothetical protein K439DRAFT_1657491 [Ramaria rubella]
MSVLDRDEEWSDGQDSRDIVELWGVQNKLYDRAYANVTTVWAVSVIVQLFPAKVEMSDSPNNPPSLTDVSNAVEYISNLTVSHADRVSDDRERKVFGRYIGRTVKL